jgi:hypothetical protein
MPDGFGRTLERGKQHNNMATRPLTWNGRDANGQPFRWNQAGLKWNGQVPQTGGKRMARLRVLLAFTEAPDNALDETAGKVIQGMTNNTAFPTPPVTMLALQTAKTEFSDAVAAQEAGGKEATAAKNNKRETLITLLRKLAAYVQENCNDDLQILLSSGFQAPSSTHTQSPLTQPKIKEIINSPGAISGQLVVKVLPVPNAKSYELRYALMDNTGALGPWQSGGIFTDSRAMAVNGLTPGSKYEFQVRAIGGSTGYSGWSDGQNHMSM